MIIKNWNYRAVCNKHSALLLLRIAVGVVFLVHGIAKLQDMPATIGFFSQLGLNTFMAWFVALLETLGGAAVLLGFGTRLGATGLACLMFGIIVHVKWGKPFTGGYEYDFVLLMVNLALVFMGPGKYSLSGKCSHGKCQCGGSTGCACNTQVSNGDAKGASCGCV